MKSTAASASAAALAAAVILSGCTEDKVVGRYTTASCVREGEDPAPCRDMEPVAVASVITIATPDSGPVAPTASATPAPAPPPAPAPAAAAPAPAKPAAPVKTEAPSPVVDRTIFHRTMIVTVARDPLRFNPADRLEAVDILIRPDNAVIQSWDAAATIYSTINAGSVQLTSGQSATENASIGTPSTAPAAATLSGSLSQSESRVENFNATQQAENLTISLANNDAYKWDGANRNELRVHRQGGIGVDLTGNVIVKVDIVLPEDSGEVDNKERIDISRRWLFAVKGDYFDKLGHPAQRASLTLAPQLWLVAKHINPKTPPTPVKATVTLTYTLRHILSGDDTLEEKDDKVVEKTVVAPAKQVVLIPGMEASPRAYSVRADHGDGATMMVQRPDAPAAEPLCFVSYDAANDLLTYLRRSAAQHPETLGTATLGFSVPNPGHPFRPVATPELAGLEAVGACPD